MKSPIRTLSLALAVAGSTLGTAATASAATTATWSCRGSVVELQLGANSRLAPVVADQTPCKDAATGVPNLGEAAGLAPAITAQTAYATTSATPPSAFPKDQATGADAGVEGLEVRLLDGAVTVGVDAARSAVSGRCSGGTPTITGSSTVLGLRINGQPVVADGLLSSVLTPLLNPLGRVVQVKLDEQIADAGGVTRRAAHVIVLPGVAGGAPLADLVIAESRLTSAAACDPAATNNTGTPPPTAGPGSPGGSGTSGAGAGGNATGRVCPVGSTLDVDRTLCIIAAKDSGGQGAVVVGAPFSGPSGGRVISLAEARKRYASACLRGSGPRFVTVGTNRRDRITGTNRADRILGLGGDDAIDSGRADDCVDGGTDRDNLAGGLGADRVYGMAGKDAINGGPGTDRLAGGDGNDTINAAFGQDVVMGGAGVDFINVATAGRAARVDCGGGRDKVRFNRNERRRLQGCETRFELRD